MGEKIFMIKMFMIVTSYTSYSQSNYFNAIEKDNIDLFKKELTRGSDVNFQRSSDNYSPLILASKLGKKDFVSLLLEKKVNSELKANNGNTALLFAIDKSRFEIVNLLIESGANIIISNNEGITPLILASSNGYNLEIVKTLVKKKVDLEMTDNNRNTALMTALRKNQLEIADFLIENGAKMSNKDISDQTSLMLSCYHNNSIIPERQKLHMKIINDILSSGVSVNDPAKNGNTPLILVCQNGNLDILKLLVEHKANIADKSMDGASALGEAARYGNLEVIEFLLKNGADMNIKCQNQLTPLILSLENKKFKVARYLIDQNADLNYLTENGNSALKAAIRSQNDTLVELVVNKTNPIFKLENDEDDAILAYSSLINDKNRITSILLAREHYFVQATNYKNLADSLPIEKQSEYLSKYIENLEFSYSIFGWREQEYRATAEKIQTANAGAFIVGIALSVVSSSLDPNYIHIWTPKEIKDPGDLLKIADTYQRQLKYLRILIDNVKNSQK